MAARAEEPSPARLDEVRVTAKYEDLLGAADSASDGVIPGAVARQLPLLRPAEALELVPGLVITQHSGAGKGNQYFLRGFNLDHGTDFLFRVAGMQVNLPTHGHGQGYADLNFLIPELVETIRYSKGPYQAQDGDFATAGAAKIDYVRALPGSLAQIGYGENGYGRLLLAGSPAVAHGTLLYGLELGTGDGPWENPDNYRRYNGVLRLSRGGADNGWALTAMGYGANWDATDQIPLRAVHDGRLCRFCAVDPGDGGESHRYSLSMDWARGGPESSTRANAYVLDYRLNLWSNFTYFLAEPVNGDQFEQVDERTVWGLNASHTWNGNWGSRPVENTLGLQLLHNDIHTVGLFATRARNRLSVTREDSVRETRGGLYFENRVDWSPVLRSIAGLRYDTVRHSVSSDNPFNSGSGSDGQWSPKLSLAFGPWSRTEFYANYGYGFHSNDVRGATIRVDPVTGDPAPQVPALVQGKGGELGVRTGLLPGLQSTLALWRLDLDSELVYVGDAGTTEPSFASRRQGVEWATSWAATRWLSLNLDLAWTRARFVDNPAGDRIPGAIETAASFIAAVDNLDGWFGAVKLNYFGPRPLVEDNSVRSSSSTLANARVGYRLTPKVSAWLDVFNLFERDVSDIEYFYQSRLPGEPADGLADIHFHPAEPRTLRVFVQVTL
jgi:outer membrane receptor protein involved in Fe transport